MLRKTLGLAGLMISLLIPAAARAEKHALLIGINDYKFYGPTNVPAGQNLPPFDLFGCVNDVLETEKFLISQGFKKSNITTILDQQATKANMLAAMQAAAARVKPSDVFYFHFSGHGFQLAAAEASTEDDAQDELLACADYSGDPFAAGSTTGDAGCIRDDFIATWIPSFKTSKKIFIFDCCHSGTVSRDLGMRKRRLPTVRLKPGQKRGLTVAARSFGEGIRKQSPQTRGIGARDFVVLSACKDDQTAADTGTFGAFSFNLLEAYKKSDAADPIGEVLNAASRGIASKGMSQEPQPTLSGKYQADPTKATLRTLLIEDVAGGTQPPPEIQPSPPLPPDPLNTEKITVKLLGLDAAATQTIGSGINALGHAQLTQGLANRVISRDAGTGKTQLLSADGAELLDLTGLDASKILQNVNPYLIQAYMMRKLSILDNPNSRFNVTAQLTKSRTLVLQQAAPGVDPTTEDPMRPTIFIGDAVFFNVTVDKPAFVTLINVATNGGVEVLFSSVQATPGTMLQFPPPGARLSDGRLVDRIGVEGPEGTEMVLVLATAKPLDMSQFNLKMGELGMRSVASSSVTRFAANSKSLVLQAAGPDESGWGSAILLATVRNKPQQ